MIKKKLINIGLIGCGIVGLRQLENLPSNFKLIGCSNPIISIDKIFKNKRFIFRFKLEEVNKSKKFMITVIF